MQVGSCRAEPVITCMNMSCRAGSEASPQLTCTPPSVLCAAGEEAEATAVLSKPA